MKTGSVLVTGADQHQGLAVIRGLGMAGVPVVAASAVAGNIGFASRYARETALYSSPFEDMEQFIEDIIAIIQRYDIAMVVPAVESTLVALDRYRDRIERYAPLAAPDSATLEWAVDKLKTIELAKEVDVPVPKTLCTNDLDYILGETRDFRFPVAAKPRGNALHRSTANHLGFKVKYARSHEELAQLLKALRPTGALPMVQEYVCGIGVCVTALFDNGRPVVMVPYQRVRELPLTGGVSVLRKTLPRDPQLEGYVTRLLAAKQWHGAAMVEFKYDADSSSYTLMEINGRFPASTALFLDAGINIPYLAYCLHAGLPLPPGGFDYEVGVQERWLRGDLPALLAHLTGTTAREAVPEARAALPSRWRALRDFVVGFAPGVRYDEFKWHDPWPGVIETIDWGRSLIGAAVAPFARRYRRLTAHWRAKPLIGSGPSV
jgi:predicted ATP-grasp superfamily ATP-dependent carboligase